MVKRGTQIAMEGASPVTGAGARDGFLEETALE